MEISGTKDTKRFTYRKPFEVHFRDRHQGFNHNNQRHVPIYLERTWVTKSQSDSIFAQYLAVSEVNTYLASDHFQNDGVVQPHMDFRRYLSTQCVENTSWIVLGHNGQYKISCKVPLYTPCEKNTVKHYGRMQDTSLKKGKSETDKQTVVLQLLGDSC